MSDELDRAADEQFMAALRAGGVACGDDSYNDWVDDNGQSIRRALLAAGWTPPPHVHVIRPTETPANDRWLPPDFASETLFPAGGRVSVSFTGDEVFDVRFVHVESGQTSEPIRVVPGESMELMAPDDPDGDYRLSVYRRYPL